MSKIFMKCLILILLIGCLIGLVLYHPFDSYEKVKITDKYYSPKPGEKLIGSKTKKKLSIPTNLHSETCAMEFDNGNILKMNCTTFLNYQIGEYVKIKYKDGRLLDIRRK